MGPKSAARLARLCSGGTRRDIRAGWAWSRLSRAAALGDRNALIAVWRLWLASPDADELWDVLARRLRPDELADAVLAGVVEPKRSPESRAAIGEYCVRRGAVPEDEARRALFHVLTGQLSQHIETDPDAASLAAAYDQADPATQAALRRAIVRSADLDPVRVVTGVGDPRSINSLAADERRFLFTGLAARHDWDGLWRLVRDLPVADAVASMRRFPEDWLPVGGRERVLFGWLSRADPARIAAARDAASRPEVVRLELDQAPTRGCFSPDGRQLLLAMERDGRYAGCRVVDLPGGTLRERHDYQGDLPPARILHLGRSYVIIGRQRSGVSELVRYENGRSTVLYWSERPLLAARTAAGIVILATGLASHARTWGGGPAPGTSLFFCDDEGDVVTEWRSAGIAQGVPAQRFWLESDPTGRRVAYGPAWDRTGIHGDLIDAHGNRLMNVRLPVTLTDFSVPRMLRPASQRTDARVAGACFTSRDRVVAVDERGQVVSCRSGPGVAMAPHAVGVTLADAQARRDVVFLPDPGRIAVIDAKDGVRYLDPDTLTDAWPSGPLAGESGTMLAASPDDRALVLGGPRGRGGFLQIAWDGHPGEAATLARRPMADMTSRDLTTFIQAPGAAAPAEVRPLLDLTRECLKARFAGADEPADGNLSASRAAAAIEDARPPRSNDAAP